MLASVVLSQYTRVTDRQTDKRQTTSYGNSGACSTIATFR